MGNMSDLKPEFSANFLNAVDTLMVGYNEEVYMKLLDTFGTHYIQAIKMGSKYGQLSEFSKEGWKTMQEQSIQVTKTSKVSGFFFSKKRTEMTDLEESQAE